MPSREDEESENELKERMARELVKDGIPLPTVASREDILSDAQAGRVGGVFTVGEKIEYVKEEHEREEVKFKHWMEALSVTGKTLEEFKVRVKKDANDARITIKEQEYAIKYIQRCIDLVTKLFNDADAKRLQSDGAKQALELATKMIKRIYDDERDKLRRMEEYLATPGETARERILNRPPGVHPGEPLKEMIAETEALDTAPKDDTGLTEESKPPRSRKRKTKNEKPSE